MTFWLALALIWLGLSAFLLVAVNQVRGRIEQRAKSSLTVRQAISAVGLTSEASPAEEVVVGRIQRNGFRYVHPKKESHRESR